MRIRLICWVSGLLVLCSLPATASAGWSVQRTPDPKGAKTSTLSSVSCARSNACTAVGVTGRGPLAERWNGTSWKIQDVLKLSDRANGSGPYAAGGRALVERWQR
jgi:hypothetical protein